jgi:hypothetical protein
MSKTVSFLLFLILSFSLAYALKSSVKALISTSVSTSGNHDDDDGRNVVSTPILNLTDRPPKGCVYLYLHCGEQGSLNANGIHKVCHSTFLNQIPQKMDKNLSGLRAGVDTRVVLKNRDPKLNLNPKIVTNKDGFFNLCAVGGAQGPWNDDIVQIFIEDDTPAPETCLPTLLAPGPDEEPKSVVLLRYFNEADHFYTTNPENEILGAYELEGRVGKCHSTQEENTFPFHRYWSGTDHFYTTNVDEIGTIIPGAVGKFGYKYEGVACYIYKDAKAQKSLKPIFRFWNGIDHYYSLKMEANGGCKNKNQICNNGYMYEGIAGYMWKVHKGINKGLGKNDHDE